MWDNYHLSALPPAGLGARKCQAEVRRLPGVTACMWPWIPERPVQSCYLEFNLKTFLDTCQSEGWLG